MTSGDDKDTPKLAPRVLAEIGEGSIKDSKGKSEEMKTKTGKGQCGGKIMTNTIIELLKL